MSATESTMPSDDRDHGIDEPHRESRRIPHSVFGIGAFLLLLLAAIVLILLSGHFARRQGGAMVVLIGIPAMNAFTVLVAKRWRRARMGHT
jgi:hypothetical protein